LTAIKSIISHISLLSNTASKPIIVKIVSYFMKMATSTAILIDQTRTILKGEFKVEVIMA